MAKLFYTLEEAAQKLRRSTDEVLAMAKAGQLQELKDKDQVLFRRSAIDQLAAEDEGGELNLEHFDGGASASDIRLGGSSFGGEDMRLEDEPRGGKGGADDSMSIGLADSTVHNTPSKPAAPAARSTPSPAASAGGSASGMGLADSNADSMMLDAPGAAAPRRPDDSGGPGGSGRGTLEAVGSGSGLLDISSDESFFGAQMIEESMGGEDQASLPADAGDIFGGGEAAPTEEATPITTGTSGVTFGTAVLAEAQDPKFSGFTAGAMVVVALALAATGWALLEASLGNSASVGKMIAENWMYVLGGGVVGVLLAGGIGLGIGKATA